MKKIFLILSTHAIISCTYATNNRELLTSLGNYCYQVEANIAHGANMNNENSLTQINDCLRGITYRLNKHSRHNHYYIDDELGEYLVSDGSKYKLQYFHTVDEVENAITDTNNSIINEISEAKQKRSAEIKLQKEITSQLDKCYTNYYNSLVYKKYITTKNKFLETRYNTCINNGYDSTTCWAYKTRDSFGYDLAHQPPANNCN